MTNNNLMIVKYVCTCGGTLYVARAWVEDTGETGVIECACRACGARMIVEVCTKEDTHE